MFLFNEFPTDYAIGGLRLKINYDFRTSMRFEMLMQDNNFNDEEKLEIALKLYFGEQFIIDYEQAIKAILDFYTLGKFSEKRKAGKENQESRRIKAIYSFEHDGKLFYSSFLEQYQIDLIEEKNLHWWKFRALFEGLNENTKLAKAMAYRSLKIPKGLSREERNNLMKLKKLYALPDMRTEAEKERDFANALF